MARTHKKLMIFFAENENCKVYCRNKQFNTAFLRIDNPTFLDINNYIVTNSEEEDELFRKWNDDTNDVKLQIRLRPNGEWRDMSKDHILDFQSYEYKVKLSDVELAFQEADEQKNGTEPIDIYKWHYGSFDDSFMRNNSEWHFCPSIYCDIQKYEKCSSSIGYYSSSVYKKIKN